MKKEITVYYADDGMRLDRKLSKLFPSLSHTVFVKEMRKGNIRVNDAKGTPDMRLKKGDIIRYNSFLDDLAVRAGEEREEEGSRGKPPPSEAKIRRIEDAIIENGKDILVLNKPAGFAAQAGTGITHGIDDILRALFPDEEILPVHRLDRDTTGVLLFAKNRQTAARLSEALRHREARKIYIAALQGVPSKNEGTLMTYFRKEADNSGQEKMRSFKRPRDKFDKKAVTEFTVIDHCVKRYALARMAPLTGRTHQLRVHMAELGAPIIGDFKYGYVKDDDAPKDAMLLHAADIALPGGKIYRAEPPETFKEFCEKTGLDMTA